MIMIEDLLTSYSSTNGLSANMGRVLNESIEAIDERVTKLENNSSACECKTVIW